MAAAVIHPATQQALLVRRLGCRDYLPVWHAMQRFTAQRRGESPDEVWLVEHPPVFTLGLNGKPHHVLDARDIPLIHTDRGGQVTYHGPGQLVAYLLFDLKRHGLGVRSLVSLIEQSVIDLLADYGIQAQARKDAPGVYVAGAKIAALGLRIKQGCSYHGLSLNIAMDLEPFSRINPCGYEGLHVTQLSDLGIIQDVDSVAAAWLARISRCLGYHQVTPAPDEKRFIHDGF